MYKTNVFYLPIAYIYSIFSILIDTSSNSEMIQAGRFAESTTSDTSTSVGKNK